MTSIHPTAIVEDGAVLGAEVTVGPWSYIGRDVVLGDGVKIDSHVICKGHTSIGDRTEIYSHAAIGLPTEDPGYAGEYSAIAIGSDCKIREMVTIHPGTAAGRTTTVVGDRVLLMGHVHIGHDAVIGDDVIIVNSSGVAGRSVIGRCTVIGGMSGVHPSTRVGPWSIAGAGSIITSDVIPFGAVYGNRASLSGINIRGMRKHGFQRSDIMDARHLFNHMFFGDDDFGDRLENLLDMTNDSRVLREFQAFFGEDRKRPFCQPRKSDPGSLEDA